MPHALHTIVPDQCANLARATCNGGELCLEGVAWAHDAEAAPVAPRLTVPDFVRGVGVYNMCIRGVMGGVALAERPWS